MTSETKKSRFDMGIDKFLPANITRCMPAEERKALKVETPEEIGERVAVKLEKDLHDQFRTWCTMKDLEVSRARMDRKSTIEKGFPDFLVVRGMGGFAYACAIEMKRPGESLTIDQEKVIWRMKERGVPVAVCDNLVDAIRFTLTSLQMETA